ncbi:hypothetical protein [Nocardioides sp.]|jgi:uncharacterized membrane protein HdeD (DUF308 family)|uniref:hypothetical protein n=1 Tax=Nocardioides sp. TaxID=35761 RepID=UPI000D3266CF|nr:hypothetical protein [Nocardioides sp.]HSX68434.1 hypothetical protein [Nocardioides sp.]
MAPGIVLLVIGGIFAFAITAESSWLDTDMLGLVLMLGGVGFIVRSRMARKEVTTRDVVRGPGPVDASAPEGDVVEHTELVRRLD